MPEVDIGYDGLALSLVLVAVALALSAWRGLGLERSILWACARSLVQLALVGVALTAVFDTGLAVAWLWVVLMVLVAGFVVARRAPEVPDALPLALLALAAAAVVTLGVLFGLGVFPLEPRYLIPVSGLMVGNSMKDTVVSARRVVGELRDKRPEVEARLALGQPWQEAARPYLRSAIRTGLISQIESTKAVGLVALPGAMTGLILAGVDPVDAVKVQAAVMYLILGAVATTTTVVSVGLARRLFTRDHRLVRLPRPAETT